MNVQLNPTEAEIVASTHIGIIGGGQLGLMISEAGRAMGYQALTVLDPTPNAPAAVVAEQIEGELKDPQALRKLAERSDILTYEIEHINTEALEQLQNEGHTIHPSPQILAVIQDKFRQKEFLAAHGIPVAPFRSVASRSDIEELAQTWGYPLVLKAKKDAYDGRGNARINNAEDIDSALAHLAGRELYVEQRIDLEKELGLMISRNARGEIAAHPVVEMIHERDICQAVLAPAPIDATLLKEAETIAHQAIDQLHGIGIFGVELFLDKAGKLWLNEIAPRPHNSGHYTIEACLTSQFEQHLRAITNLSLGTTTMRYPASVMINILGERNGPAEVHWSQEFDPQHVFVHLYGKRETRIDRKMGHITVVGDNLEDVYQLALKVRAALTI
ncbi:N5-carboxyaminoimidazole ribonucleotide synthase [Ktedonobacter sp. SOSP1-52]|uniref:5-(carboxyamino)imidazole ribonucleotide synthase n=1 Tax=Ktedonobacter sp. SOSP1-52 TaxID=2778366 RepID=UPI001914EC45|nr:5-(carboxyamino)imidazole ribonucleotide synthase [Ktedonobacter sp. SOSP1-52]GHO68982.1 N5-carboxyaminoimidazole ribonucleotide synthase [Ktedonobacter sp. SOSP1-52]